MKYLKIFASIFFVVFGISLAYAFVMGSVEKTALVKQMSNATLTNPPATLDAIELVEGHCSASQFKQCANYSKNCIQLTNEANCAQGNLTGCVPRLDIEKQCIESASLPRELKNTCKDEFSTENEVYSKIINSNEFLYFLDNMMADHDWVILGYGISKTHPNNKTFTGVEESLFKWVFQVVKCQSGLNDYMKLPVNETST